MAAETTRVLIGQREEQGTHCKFCKATYLQCTIDVLREPRDPKANDGCCDQCRDASGHETSAAPDPAREALLEIREITKGWAEYEVELKETIERGLGYL